jgi:hypothetical protein
MKNYTDKIRGELRWCLITEIFCVNFTLKYSTRLKD